MGTGMGFALFQDGQIAPHLELSQHPIRKRKTYDEYVGEAALEAVGRRRWNKRVRKIIGILETVITYDTLYIGGGNAELIEPPLPANVKIVSNIAGITGGVRLWDGRMDHAFADSHPVCRTAGLGSMSGCGANLVTPYRVCSCRGLGAFADSFNSGCRRPIRKDFVGTMPRYGGRSARLPARRERAPSSAMRDR